MDDVVIIRSGRPILLELEHDEAGFHEVHVRRHAGAGLRRTGENVSAELRAGVEPSDGGTNKMAVVFPRTTFPGFILRVRLGSALVEESNRDRSSSSRDVITSQSARRSSVTRSVKRAIAATNCSTTARMDRRPRSMRWRSTMSSSMSSGPSKPSRCSSGVEGTRGGTSQSSQSGSAPVSLPPARSRTSLMAVVGADVEHERLPVDAQLADRLPRRPVGRLEAHREPSGALQPLVVEPLDHADVPKRPRRAPVRVKPNKSRRMVVAEVKNRCGTGNSR